MLPAISETPLEQEAIAAATAATAWGVGPWHAGEFRVLRTVLGDAGQWPTFEKLSKAIETASGNPAPPEVLLLAQPRPGYFAESEVAAFARLAPLTRLVVVAGTWCEGEPRTGRPLSGAPRLYWYEFAAWWRQALADRDAGRQPAWADPLAEARFRFAAARTVATPNGALRPQPMRVTANRVAVDVGDYESFIALQIALKPHGWHCVWQPRHRPEVWNSQRARGRNDGLPVAGIWDGGQLDEVEAASLAAFADRLSPRRAPVLALLDFPRAEHFAAVRAAGAVTVLGKPYCIDALADELARAVGDLSPA